MNEPYVNYYLKSVEELKDIKEGEKPSLLLHACCGPCSCFPLTFLCPHFKVTIFFNNSNIYPQNEYERRLEELKKFLGYFERDYGYHVDLIVTPYDNDLYNKDLEPYASLPEGQERCFICYRKRMKEAFDYAEQNGFDYFTTVMTISRQKDSQILNKIGRELEKGHAKCKYFYSDFKKKKGIDIAREMRIHYDLYNQLYCGCKYTYGKGLLKAKEKGIDWKG
ncbi:MAG: epoxyqueuosine reductase QueH [Bacilli bacterium]|jgi:predicted adenine nucleotide alpha hydrolase (AANH) superfamily ATPase|nr:epoxyqueuosine reductase QueH [Bacilli bacterium]MCH4228143.1 epoxyqueuosine reductase QueH [Bacilli bacterium]MCH4278147.1 epoxyqueuosine reductase QueH [Bacilli bacterium]MCI2054551.1 epoxyqueuosine reductase QueH [Bacilli bacterium]